MTYSANHTLGEYAIFNYIFVHKGAIYYNRTIEYKALIDYRRFNYRSDVSSFI